MQKDLLDFSIYSDEDREKWVEQQLAALGRNPTQKELDLFANYILFGKGPDGASVVDKGLVTIPTKYSSYKKKDTKTLSLDELRENPAFDERSVKPLQRDNYTHPRQELKKKVAEELEPLRMEIKKLQHVYDVATGKAEDASLPPLNPTQIYHLNHQLISLKSQQYVVQEGITAPVSAHAPPAYAAPADPAIEIWPMGAYFGTEKKRFENPHDDHSAYTPTYGDWDAVESRDRVVDFTNRSTVRSIIEHYAELYEVALESPLSDAAQLLSTLEWYVKMAHLTPSRQELMRMKINKVPNSIIKDYINEKYNRRHNDNYISTIYTRDVCTGIAEAAKLHYTQWVERDNPAAWKKCIVCGKWHLKEREFKKRPGTNDGLAARCIWCDSDLRNDNDRRTTNARIR